MKRVILFNTKALAESRNYDEARSRQCPIEGATYWWIMRECTDGKYALMIGQDEVIDKVHSKSESYFLE